MSSENLQLFFEKTEINFQDNALSETEFQKRCALSTMIAETCFSSRQKCDYSNEIFGVFFEIIGKYKENDGDKFL